MPARQGGGDRTLRILLVEDEQRLAELLSDALRRQGWAVDAVGSCADAYAALRVASYRAMVLDLGLPDGDGMALLRNLRAVGDTLPVLVLTARGRLGEKVAGLNAGADDYMVKPCATPELHARLLALTRRASGAPAPVLRLGPLEFDQSSRMATVHGEPLRLTLRPAMVLESLLQAKGRFVSRTQLQENLVSFQGGLESGAIEVYITRLRRSLEERAPEIRIENQRGFGYRILLDPSP
nr:response regulator transcription factor [Siccirubricoccus soli]